MCAMNLIGVVRLRISAARIHLGAFAAVDEYLIGLNLSNAEALVLVDGQELVMILGVD